MSPDVVSDYAKQRPIYVDLCTEIRRIVDSSFSQSGIRFHSIEARAKEVESFERKIHKTNENGEPKYENPIDQITDKAGVRIIVYTIDDIKTTTDFLDKNFDIIEKRDVGEERVNKGQFGYQSIHYLVKMTNTRLSLPEFSKFCDHICEIQVRTVLQHAWAEMEHDIQYKGSENIPKTVRRKFLALAGLLEIADREFSSIQREDRELKKDVLNDLQRELTLDTIEKISASRTSAQDNHSNTSDDGTNFQVRDLISAGRYSEAIEIYNTKIESEPTSYTLFLGRARAYFLLGKTDNALRDINKAEELQPGNHRINNLKLQIIDGSLSQVLNTQKNESNKKVKDGDIALINGNPEEAYILYAEAQDSGASWPFTTFKMALAGLVAGDFSGAKLFLDQLSIHPGTPMEINIAALNAMLSGIQKRESLPDEIDHVRNLVSDKGDFKFELSPLALLERISPESLSEDLSDVVAEVLETLRA